MSRDAPTASDNPIVSSSDVPRSGKREGLGRQPSLLLAMRAHELADRLEQAAWQRSKVLAMLDLASSRRCAQLSLAARQIATDFEDLVEAEETENARDRLTRILAGIEDEVTETGVS